MAIPLSKKRKTAHVSSEAAEADTASFASFGTSDDDGANDLGDNADIDEDMLDDGVEEEEELGEEDSSDDDEDAAEEIPAVPSTNTDRPPTRPPANHTGPPRAGPEVAANGAYASGTFKSNMFKLQVDELLTQIRPRRGKREEAAETALHALKKSLETAPARPPLSIEEAEKHLLKSSKVVIPFPEPRPSRDAKYKLEYAKPANINVVGSYALQTSSRTRDVLEIDMSVTMPSTLFQEKDYLNFRYFYKRAYYLACIAASLKDAHGSTYDIRFSDFHDDPLKAILVVVPTPSTSKDGDVKPARKWQINIIPCVAADVFAPEKLTPKRNCIRPSDETKAEPTLVYNASLRADMVIGQYLKLIHSASTSCPGFKDACLLGGTWLRQRGFGTSISAGGFGRFEWSALMALMLQGGGANGKPMLSAGYSSYQLFKGTMQVLGMKNLSKQALLIGSPDTNITVAGDGRPMVWDAARSHSLLHKATPWAYALLRKEARTTLSMLGDQLYDGFAATFIMRSDHPLLRYDTILEVPQRTDLSATQFCSKLHTVLKRGLGDRITHMNILATAEPSWDIASAQPRRVPGTIVKVGIITNPDTLNRTVDHGPSAESKAEAAAFRAFWGEKAEMRRFKDGSITETLIWSSESGLSVLEQIVRYVLSRHINESVGEGVHLVGDGFSRLLRQGGAIASFQPMMEAFKQLGTDIRGLEGMPLSVREIMPADSQLRYASIVPPGSAQAKQRPVPANVTIQFEGSARWPDDLAAIQRTKIAFLLRTAELLQQAHDSVTAQVGLENQDTEILNQAYIDIAYENGAAFRMRIYHDREQTLLERNLKNKSLSPSAKATAAQGLAAYKRDYLKAPAHTQAVAKLCSRYPALSGTIRLLKKWFASHLLSNHIPEEVIELIAARTFTQPWPWQAPSSVQTGFLRTLHWLSRWDWRADPLIVDLSGTAELKKADNQVITLRFEAWRKLDPSLNRVVLFTASSLDPDGTTWTDGQPAKVIAGRMTALAKAACTEIESKAVELEPASLFASPLTDFDFVLHLNTAGKKRKTATTFKNLELDALTDRSLIGLDTHYEFLQELEDIYGSAVLFFAGGAERPVIAGLWSPLTATRAWKVNLAFSTVPRKAGAGEEADVHADLNRSAMLAEMARLGGDLVERMEVKGV